MEKFRVVLLNVWREACRHIEIGQATETIADMLVPEMPIDRVLVERIDRQRSCLETVAAGRADADDALRGHRPECTTAQMERLLAFCRRGKVEHRRARSALDGVMRLVVPPGIDADLLAGPLGTAGQCAGVLLLLARPQQAFTARHAALAEVLLEPFTVALENDGRLREMAALREAAEADKRSLLVRLGREKLGDTLVGADSGLRGVMERVALVAGSDVPVLILGETGTGKELLARVIHGRSPRAPGPIHRVNCGAIPPDLIDSELFGHERGAFTGAVETRKGWFERADGGTLFLDEIGELPPAAQVRLLRILQDGWLERVGGEQPIHVDVRIVAATHRDLARMVAEGKFREDLWYRIAVFPMVLPPLRERREDVGELAAHFARRAAVRFGLPVAMPSEEDTRLLKSYPWPGNVRELATVVNRAAILGEGHGLRVAQALGVATTHHRPAPHDDAPPGPAEATRPRQAPIAPFDTAIAHHIEAALAACHGRIEGPRGAAALLQVNPHTLRARMRKLGIDWARFRKRRC